MYGVHRHVLARRRHSNSKRDRKEVRGFPNKGCQISGDGMILNRVLTQERSSLSEEKAPGCLLKISVSHYRYRDLSRRNVAYGRDSDIRVGNAVSNFPGPSVAAIGVHRSERTTHIYSEHRLHTLTRLSGVLKEAEQRQACMQSYEYSIIINRPKGWPQTKVVLAAEGR